MKNHKFSLFLIVKKKKKLILKKFLFGFNIWILD